VKANGEIPILANGWNGKLELLYENKILDCLEKVEVREMG